MSGNLIKDYMSSSILSVDSKMTIQDAARLMMDKGTRSLLIKEDGNYAGIVTKTDFILRVYVDESMDPELDIVSSIMSKGILTMDAKSSMEEARKFMQKNKIGHLLVTEDDKTVGIISKKDLLRYFGNLT